MAKFTIVLIKDDRDRRNEIGGRGSIREHRERRGIQRLWSEREGKREAAEKVVDPFLSISDGFKSDDENNVGRLKCETQRNFLVAGDGIGPDGKIFSLSDILEGNSARAIGKSAIRGDFNSFFGPMGCSHMTRVKSDFSFFQKEGIPFASNIMPLSGRWVKMQVDVFLGIGTRAMPRCEISGNRG